MKILVIMLVLLGCSAWLMAQTSSKHPGHAASQQDTVDGCLMGSDGNFTITDSTGIKYKLSGDTAQLSSHTGHQVEVKGKVDTSEAEATNSPTSTDTSTGTQGTGTATKQGVVQTFHISKVMKTAGACSEKK